MSHLQDIEPIFWSSGPKSPLGCTVLAVFTAVAIVWAAMADSESEALCNRHGEKYVDSNSQYTLCERPDGTVVRRHPGVDDSDAGPLPPPSR